MLCLGLVMGKLTGLSPRLGGLIPKLGSATLQTVERKRGTTGIRQRMATLEAHGVLCSRCGTIGAWKRSEASITLPLLIVDHELPLAMGGRDDERNRRVVCEPCHLILTDEQFGRSPPRTV